MSRLTLLTSALAVLALGAGAIGYADTGKAPEGVRDEGVVAVAPRIAAPGAAAPPADVSAVVERGEGLAAALLRSGVGGLDAALAAGVAGEVAGSAELWLGKDVGNGARSLTRLVVEIGPGRQIVIERQGDEFIRRDVVEPVDDTPVRLRLDAGPGLAAGLVEAGLPRRTRARLLDEVAGERLAAIDLIIAHRASRSGSAYGNLLYLGAHGADGSVRRWIGAGEGLRPLHGDEAASDSLLRPLPGPVTSSPGLRFHPILRFLRWHRGTDFASPSGTPVQAALEGRVVSAGWQGGYGRTVRLAHADGSHTLYAHLSSLDVVAGEAIARGAVIGKVGASGLATGPHLHFEWQRGGETLRPIFGDVAPATVKPEQQAALRALLSAPFRLPPERRGS